MRIDRIFAASLALRMVCPPQGGGSVPGVRGPEPVCPRPDQRERRAAAGRVRPGHRGDEDQGETPVPLHRRHRLC